MMHDIISLADLMKDQLLAILDAADTLKSQSSSQERLLTDTTVLTIFPATSIRTQVTFGVAIQQLGAIHTTLPNTSLDTKEPLHDIAKYLDCWVNLVVVRHPSGEVLQKLAQHMQAPVINAMTRDYHPCEVLSDLHALHERRPNLASLKFVFVGARGNICNTWFQAAGLLDLTMTQVCPPGFEIDDDLHTFAQQSQGDITMTNDFTTGIQDADVILTDCWPADTDTHQAFRPYQITSAALKLAHPDVILNPCPPMTRGNEVSEDAIASTAFIGFMAKESLLHTQKAILLYALDRL